MDIFDQLDLYAIFHAALPDFDYYGETTVTADHYEVLKAIALAQDGEISNVFEELDAWVSECFKTETCFTILGI
jgi:hypothetical protein